MLAQISVCIAGPEQGVRYGFFIDPTALNHSSKTEGHGIERLITLALRGGTEFGHRTVERCCSISFAARPAICSRHVGKAASILIQGCAVRLPIWADDVCQPLREFGYGTGL